MARFAYAPSTQVTAMRRSAARRVTTIGGGYLRKVHTGKWRDSGHHRPQCPKAQQYRADATDRSFVRIFGVDFSKAPRASWDSGGRFCSPRDQPIIGPSPAFRGFRFLRLWHRCRQSDPVSSRTSSRLLKRCGITTSSGGLAAAEAI